MFRYSLLPCFACAVTLLAGICLAANDEDASPAPTTTETRVYDIRDLVKTTPHLPLTKKRQRDLVKEGQIWVMRDAYGPSERFEIIEQLTTLIQDTIGRQEEWAAYGGDVSSLRELNGNLIIKSTFANHKDVETLLGQLRTARARQVAVDAYYLRMPTATLDAFKREHADGAPVLSEEAADKLVDLATRKQQDIRIVGTIRLLGMNDQRVHGFAVRPDENRRPADKNPSKPAEADDRATPATPPDQPAAQEAPNPDADRSDDIHVERTPGIQNATPIKHVRSSAAIDVEPTISHDAKTIQIIVRATVSTRAARNPDSPTEAGAINTTVIFPDRGGVLLGCASHRAGGDGDDDAAGDRELILLLRARAVNVDAKHGKKQ